MIQSQHSCNTIRNKILLGRYRVLVSSCLSAMSPQRSSHAGFFQLRMLQNNPESTCASASETLNSEGGPLKDIRADIKSSWSPLSDEKEAKYLHS